MSLSLSLQPLSIRAVSSPALTEGPLDEPIVSPVQQQHQQQHRHSSSSSSNGNGHRKDLEAKQQQTQTGRSPVFE